MDGWRTPVNASRWPGEMREPPLPSKGVREWGRRRRGRGDREEEKSRDGIGEQKVGKEGRMWSESGEHSRGACVGERESERPRSLGIGVGGPRGLCDTGWLGKTRAEREKQIEFALNRKTEREKERER